ncbi:MAG: type I methionyl aminopeptidase [Patescibacteria group bacterium]|nr:type I methionyl aminopeptidase [bacterium]MDZ4240783.1 type I methionyl aminopeptidase [Patescibacteria group bacterium]
MITIKNEKEINLLREGGRRHALILSKLAEAVTPGVSTDTLNSLALSLSKEHEVIPAFLGYTPYGVHRPFPGAVCISINEEVVHGIPNENPRIVSEGDIVSVDLGLSYKGMITDAAVTVAAGKTDAESKRLLEITKKALIAGIKAAKGNGHIGDIGYAIEKTVSGSGFSIVETLAGHGVGYAVHEDPYVPNTGKRGEGDLLKPGMVLAIEPIINEGNGRILFSKDGYTTKTADGKRSAHFEHTVLITDGEAEVLT